MVKTMIREKIPDNLLQRHLNIHSINRSSNPLRNEAIANPSSGRSSSLLKSIGPREAELVNFRNKKSNEMNQSVGIPDFYESNGRFLIYA